MKFAKSFLLAFVLLFAFALNSADAQTERQRPTKTEVQAETPTPAPAAAITETSEVIDPIIELAEDATSEDPSEEGSFWQNLLDFFKENPIGSTVGGIFTALLFITSLTPTDKDDNFVMRIKNLLSLIGIGGK